MGYISFDFTLIKEQVFYPNITEFMVKLDKNTGLDNFIEKYRNGYKFSNKLLTEMLYFYINEKNLCVIKNYFDYGYLFYSIINLSIELTNELGGGKVLYYPISKDKEFVFSKATIEEIYNYFDLDISCYEWSSKPYYIAKEMKGFTP